MTKAILTNGIYEKAGLKTKVQAEKIYDIILESVREALISKDCVMLSGIGSFRVVKRARRTGRNPGTGESLIIPAREVVQFTAGKNLKSIIKQL